MPDGFTRDGVAYNSREEADLAAEIPAMYLDRATDAGFIAEAVLDSEWLKRHDAEVTAAAYAEKPERVEVMRNAIGTHVGLGIENDPTLERATSAASAALDALRTMETEPKPERIPGDCPMHGERMRFPVQAGETREPGCTCERVYEPKPLDLDPQPMRCLFPTRCTSERHGYMRGPHLRFDPRPEFEQDEEAYRRG